MDAWGSGRGITSTSSGSNGAAELPAPASGDGIEVPWIERLVVGAATALFTTIKQRSKAIDRGAATEKFAVSVVGILATFAIFTPHPERGSVPPSSAAVPAVLSGAEAEGSLRVAASDALPAEKPAVFSEAKGKARAWARWDQDVNAVPPPGAYQTSYRVMATAYMPIDTPMEGGRWTCTMRDGRSAHGIAVDPGLIPLGSHLWVPGYGHGVADDTGGAIDGHHIDLRMQNRSEMDDWGVRRVRVYVLSGPDD